MPQIEVTFDIDANGILHVGAKDKAHRQGEQDHHQGELGPDRGRDPEDGEGRRAQRRRRREEARARPGAQPGRRDGALVRKSLAEHGDKLDAGEKEKIETALKDVEEALKGDDKAAIEAKTEALMTASQKLGEKIYADAQAAQAAAGAAGRRAREQRRSGRARRRSRRRRRQRRRRRLQGSQEELRPRPARRGAPRSCREQAAGLAARTRASAF